jgi:hypothetical protein
LPIFFYLRAGTKALRHTGVVVGEGETGDGGKTLKKPPLRSRRSQRFAVDGVGRRKRAPFRKKYPANLLLQIPEIV